jgi:hypothetical protein
MRSLGITATVVIIFGLVLAGSIIPAITIFAQQPDGSFFTDNVTGSEGRSVVITCQLGQQIDPNTGQCVKIPEVCDDGIDNDFDGLTDTQDAEECPPSTVVAEVCDDGIDNDFDGLTDTQDAEECPTQGGLGGVLSLFNPPDLTSPEPVAAMLPLIVVASIVVIGGIALGKYSKNRGRGRRIRIPSSAVVDIHTKGGRNE